MVAHVIHDWNRKDRFELLCKEIYEQNLSVVIWDACKGSMKPRVDISRCHKRIVQYAKENKMEEVIVMEDDCHWVAKGAFEYFINKKPKEYDLYLSSVLNGRIEGDGSLHGTVTGFQAYMVHQNFYDRFLEADPNLDIDHAIMKANYKAENKAKIICCYPFATMEHNTFSDNTKKFHDLNRLYHDRKFFTGE